jgi:hypothetical protein
VTLTVFAERAGGADLVEANEPRVAGNVGGDYGRQIRFVHPDSHLLNGVSANRKQAFRCPVLGVDQTSGWVRSDFC